PRPGSASAAAAGSRGAAGTRRRRRARSRPGCRAAAASPRRAGRSGGPRRAARRSPGRSPGGAAAAVRAAPAPARWATPCEPFNHRYRTESALFRPYRRLMLSVSRGAALYVGALVGPGLLLVPALAAQAAGPASILAWAALLVLCAPLAIAFAGLGM